jgi:hypothetical protein
MLVLVNVLVGYAAWLAVALLAARGAPLMAVLPSLFAVVLHLALKERGARGREAILSLIAALVGLVVECLLMHIGVTSYAVGATTAGLPPAFMIGLWMAFATFINVSLAWLKPRVALAALLGAVASGPSYLAGSKLGALTLGEPIWQSLVIIGLLWAVAFPLLVIVARRLDR